jgi:AcrR family transcriptional regulator
MRDEERQERHRKITQAAYDLLAVKGYSGTSMLSIAKAAKASNETLYRWYGDKRGLFEAMVRDNTASLNRVLDQALEDKDDPKVTLQRIAPILLEMLLGERAISLNRAAASDPTGELGAAISAGGRGTVKPMIAKVMTAINDDHTANPADMTEWFIGLLIGDLQIKRVIGTLPEPSKEECQQQSQKSLQAFFNLLAQTRTAP